MNKKVTVTYIYIKDTNKPTPMLAYHNTPNINVFNDEYKYIFNNDFINDNSSIKHIWNMNAYIIYNEELKKVISYKFNEPEYFLWLLRIINLELEIIFNDDFVRENQDFFVNTMDELSCKSN